MNSVIRVSDNNPNQSNPYKDNSVITVQQNIISSQMTVVEQSGEMLAEEQELASKSEL